MRPASLGGRREEKSVSTSDAEGRQREPFSCSARQLPTGATIVRATGDVNGETCSRLYHFVAEELAREPTQLVLQLSEAMPVDHAVLEALVAASALAGESDISFCLVAPRSSPIVRALAAAGLIERFEIFATVREAERNG